MARVDYDAMIAKLPAEMVEKALETAPKEFALCARNPEQDLPMPSHPYPYVTTSGLVTDVTDWRTGEYRPSTREDAGEFAKLGDALEAVDFLWIGLVPARSVRSFSICWSPRSARTQSFAASWRPRRWWRSGRSGCSFTQ